MTHAFSKVNAFSKEDALNVIVETPAGSRTKYKLDEATGLFTISHVLADGLAFPFDFGFVPNTRGEDGDPLDVIVLVDEPTFAGCLLPCRLIGVIEANQTEGPRTFRNDRFVAVPLATRKHKALVNLSELEERDAIVRFFVEYNRLRGRVFEPIGDRDAGSALQIMKKAKLRSQ